MKWVSLRAKVYFYERRNTHGIVVHSLDFGGRGVYIPQNRDYRQKRIRGILKNSIYGSDLDKGNGFFALSTLILIGMFVFGVAECCFDMIRDFPGEGHKVWSNKYPHMTHGIHGPLPLNDFIIVRVWDSTYWC